MSGDPPRRRDPSDYRPDLRPMLILVALLAAIVVGWIVIGPRILPAAVPSEETGLEGRWTRTPEAPTATTLELTATRYRLGGDLPFTGGGRAARVGDELVLADDAACPDGPGRYRVLLGDVERFGLLPENRAPTMTLSLVEDPCADRASVLNETTWTLRASGRDGVHGICDPPNEEAAITGHWPEPSGCGAT